MVKTPIAYILKKFGLKVFGSIHKEIGHIGSLKQQKNSSLLWAKNKNYLALFEQGIVVCHSKDFESFLPNSNVTYLICSESPRLVFSKIVNEICNIKPEDQLINCVETFRSRADIIISDNVFIGKNVSIGKGTIIHPNVCIYSRSKIGENCVIQSNSSIATEGLGLEFDAESQRYFKFPQIGGVVIGDDVEIGPNSTIRKSALDDTIIGSGTMIGALCNIGHNCEIGVNCILTCNVITSGSSIIGDKVFMGVSSIIRQGINIGDNATIGQGAVVITDVPIGETWVGNPAYLISKR